MLDEVGPKLLASLQGHLNSHCDAKAQERYPLPQAVKVQSAAGGQSFPGQLRDIGRAGLTFSSPSAVPLGAVTVTLGRWQSPETVQVPGWVRDCLPDGKRHEVEVAFAGP
jgi:hypothetical protein